MVLSMQFALSRQAKNRGGSFIVESVVAVLLLGTASLALMKLAHSSSRLRQRADRELSAVLTAQNAMTRLRAVDADQISQRLGEIEEACERDSGCQVELIATPFERPPVAGIHLRVEVSVSHDSRVTLHDWKVTAPEFSPDNQQASGEASGTDRPPIEGDE
jgi:hypothetical protein